MGHVPGARADSQPDQAPGGPRPRYVVATSSETPATPAGTGSTPASPVGPGTNVTGGAVVSRAAKKHTAHRARSAGVGDFFCPFFAAAQHPPDTTS